MPDETQTPDTIDTGTERVADSSVPQKTPENNGQSTDWQEYPGGPFKKDNPGRQYGSKNKLKMTDLIADAIVKLRKESGLSTDSADEEIAAVIAEMIMKGDVSLIRDYWQQRDGKPKQPIVGGDEGDKPISILTNVVQRNNSTPQDSGPHEEA